MINNVSTLTQHSVKVLKLDNPTAVQVDLVTKTKFMSNYPLTNGVLICTFSSSVKVIPIIKHKLASHGGSTKLCVINIFKVN